jgi:hypothetical protein
MSMYMCSYLNMNMNINIGVNINMNVYMEINMEMVMQMDIDVDVDIQGGALNRGLLFADPPPSPLGAVSGKISEIR